MTKTEALNEIKRADRTFYNDYVNGTDILITVYNELKESTVRKTLLDEQTMNRFFTMMKDGNIFAFVTIKNGLRLLVRDYM